MWIHSKRPTTGWTNEINWNDCQNSPSVARYYIATKWANHAVGKGSTIWSTEQLRSRMWNDQPWNSSRARLSLYMCLNAGTWPIPTGREAVSCVYKQEASILFRSPRTRDAKKNTFTKSVHSPCDQASQDVRSWRRVVEHSDRISTGVHPAKWNSCVVAKGVLKPNILVFEKQGFKMLVWSLDVLTPKKIGAWLDEALQHDDSHGSSMFA